MSDVPGHSEGSHAEPERSLDDRIGRDLRALTARSRRNMRPLTETVDGLSGAHPKRPWEERQGRPPPNVSVSRLPPNTP